MPELIECLMMGDVYCFECGTPFNIDWEDDRPVEGSFYVDCPVCGTHLEIITRVKVDYTVWLHELNDKS